MTSQEIHYLQEQASKSKEKEKRVLYSEALKFLNSPKIRNLSPTEYDLKVKEVIQIIRNKEREGLKRQTASKIDFLKLSMELENKKAEDSINLVKTRLGNFEHTNAELKKIRNESNFFIRNISSSTKDMEILFVRDKNLLLDEIIKTDEKIRKGIIKLNPEQKKKYEKIKEDSKIIANLSLDMKSFIPKKQSEKILRNKNLSKRQKIGFALGEAGLKTTDLKGKNENEVIAILDKNGVSSEDKTLILQNIKEHKTEQINEARKKIKDKKKLAKIEAGIDDFIDIDDNLKSISKNTSTKEKNLPKKIDYEPKKEQKLEQKSQNYEKIATNIERNTTINISDITSLPPTQRKGLFDKIFENIDKGQPKKLIANGIEFSISGNNGNYQVKYGDRIISGLTREKVKESISFAKFLKPLGLDFLIGHSTKIINRINEISTKGLKIHDEDGMNIMEQDLCLEKLGKAILGENYKHNTELEENKEQFVRIKSNPIKYNNSNFTNLELLAKEKFKLDSGNEFDIKKLLDKIS